MKRLFVRKITSVGAVADGDNPEARIMLFKRRNIGEYTESRIHSDFTYVADQMFGDGKLTRDERKALSAGIGSALDAFRTQLEESAPQLYERDPDMVAKTQAVAKAIVKYRETRGTDSATSEGTDMGNEEREAFEKKIADLEAKITELTAEPEDIMKDAPDEVREQFAKQQAELDAVRKAAEEQAEALVKERDARLTAEFVKTAETYQRVLGDPAKAGPMLKAFAEHDDAYKTLIEKLDAISVIVDTSDLFKELGVQDEADPSEQIASLAKEAQKDNPDLTDAQARMLVRKMRPDLKEAERTVS